MTNPPKQRKPVALKKPKTKPATKGDKFLHKHELLMIAGVHGAVGIKAWSKFMGDDVDFEELTRSICGKINRVVDDGDQKPIEAMLMSQAMMLQTVATSLIRNASFQDKLLQFQVNLNLGLKAQAQCRATLQTLAEVKNPRTAVAFVKQQNIASGHQQINNGIAQTGAQAGSPATGSHAHTEDFEVSPNELLEADHGNRLDTGAQGASGRDDTDVATVGAQHRSKDARG